MSTKAQPKRIPLARRLLRYDGQPALAFARLDGQVYLVMYLDDADNGEFLYLALPLSRASRRGYLSGRIGPQAAFDVRQGDAYICCYEHSDSCYRVLRLADRELLDKYLLESEE